jgi:hypothetical protein
MNDDSKEMKKSEGTKTVENLQEELRYVHDELSRTNSEKE